MLCHFCKDHNPLCQNGQVYSDIQCFQFTTHQAFPLLLWVYSLPYYWNQFSSFFLNGYECIFQKSEPTQVWKKLNRIVLTTLPCVEVFLPLDSLIYLSVKRHTPDTVSLVIAQDEQVRMRQEHKQKNCQANHLTMFSPVEGAVLTLQDQRLKSQVSSSIPEANQEN